APGDDAADKDRADRFVPVGLTVPFRAGAVSGELCLMSFAQTGTGARFIAAWQVHAPSLEVQLSHHYPGLIPFDEFTVTDDKRARYQLDHTPGSDLAWPNMFRLTPAPPGNIRWLDVAPPYRQAVRVDLDPLGQAGCDQAQASVCDTNLSPGEHLLVMLAERLLTGTPEFPRRGLLAAPPTRPRQAVAGGFGDIIAALEAADALSPLSPVPARLATLCASLDLTAGARARGRGGPGAGGRPGRRHPGRPGGRDPAGVGAAAAPPGGPGRGAGGGRSAQVRATLPLRWRYPS